MKRLYQFIICTVVVALGFGCSCASSLPRVDRFTSSTDPLLTVAVDSINFRSDLTRVYGKLVGRPHTSSRIDGASLSFEKQTMQATDIDGVDFNRYFQWEDDGVIQIEIDFPTMKRISNAQLILETVRGKSFTTLKRK